MTPSTPAPDQMSPERRRLLQRLQDTAAPGGKRRYPLAYSQQGILVQNQLVGGALYSMPFGGRYHGPLDQVAMWRAIRELVRRHESLRTVIALSGHMAVQEILPDMEVPETVEDLSDIPADQRDQAVIARIREHRGMPFDLLRGPLFRFVLFRLGAEDHVLHFNLHHIIADGWSVGILMREFAVLYAAFRDDPGAPPPALPPALQYGDYTLWQRGWMASAEMGRELDFWRSELAGCEESVLPTDFQRPQALSFRATGIDTTCDAATAARFNALCRRLGITPFMGMLSLFQLALTRYLGVTDFVVGTPIANRNRVETEGIVGYFVNMLMLRNEAVGPTSFRALALRVRDTTLRCLAHQNLPFVKLVEELVPDRRLHRTPLYQALFSIDNLQTFDELPGLRRAQVGQVDEPVDTKAEIKLAVIEQADGYHFEFGYHIELYRANRMQRLVRHFMALFHAALDDPDRNLWEDDLLPGEERDRLLVWAVGDEPSVTGLLPERLAVAEARHADSPAVQSEDGVLTYAELGRRSDRLASMLRRLGVGPDVAVAVLLDRGIEHVTAAVAVFKSGGVYVPIDPVFPDARIADILGDASPGVVIGTAELLSRLMPGPWTTVDVGRPDLDQTPAGTDDPEPSRLLPEHGAAVLYTSGSTGRPKGVCLTHGGLARQIGWTTGTFELKPGDRFLMKASVCFDVSIEEMLSALMSGATLVVARPRGEYDPVYLADLVGRQSVSCISMAPTLLEALLSLAGTETWPSVRLVVSGGEMLTPSLVSLVRGRLPHARLLNTYGPTEATIQSAWCEDVDDPKGVPIGVPVDGARLYVLDRHLALVPIGTPGELYIGGSGVARGYIGQPALTAARFRADPFGAPGSRMYRTGDLVRWREDGRLDFIGREDRQIKLRGYRIEIGEIERAIISHGSVRNVVVTVRGTGAADEHLAAYILPESPPGADFDVTDLRKRLARKLPSYMIPAALVVVDQLPVSSTGKIDMGALPDPGREAFSAREMEAPSGEIEKRIARIFQKILGVGEVSRLDSFFDLGGHSITALHVLLSIREAFGDVATLQTIFDAPSVAALAAVISEQSAPAAPAHPAQQHRLSWD